MSGGGSSNIETSLECGLLASQVHHWLEWVKYSGEFTTDLFLYVTSRGLHWKKVVNNFGDEYRVTLDLWQPDYACTQYELRHHSPYSSSAVFLQLVVNVGELVTELRKLVTHTQFKSTGRLYLHITRLVDGVRGRFELASGHGLSQTRVAILARNMTTDEERECALHSLGVLVDIHNYPFIGRILIEYPSRIIDFIVRTQTNVRRRDFTAFTLPYCTLRFHISATGGGRQGEVILHSTATAAATADDEEASSALHLGRYELDRCDSVTPADRDIVFMARMPSPLLLALLQPHRSAQVICLFFDETTQTLFWQARDEMQASMFQVSLHLQSADDNDSSLAPPTPFFTPPA